MTGTLTLSADPTSALQAATKQYVDTGLATKQNSLGFTPINKAGDTGVGSLALAATKTFGLGSYTAAQETTLVSGLAAADAGKTWYNSDTGEIKYWDGTTSHALGLAGGITSLNGLTGSVQTFAIGTTGNSPAFSSSGSTHTLNIPLASGGATVTAGLISNADYVAFNGKQNALGYIPVNKAGDTMTGALTTKALTVTSPATTTVAATIKAIASQSAHLLDIDDSAGTPMSYFDASGYLTLPGVPTSASQAATKGYVDSAVSSLTLATLTRGTGLTGANYNGSTATTWAVSYGSTAGTAVQGNTSITVSAGTGLSGGGSITLGAGGTVTLTNSDAGSSQNIFKSIANSAGTAQFSAASNSDKIEFGGTGLSTVSFTPASHLVSIDTTLATLTRGTGLTGTSYDGSAATTWAVSYGSTAGTAVQGNTGLTISAGSGISVTGGSVTLGSGGTVTVTNSGVTSFNTRTGAVTLSSADVTGALGYTPQSALTAGTGISIAAGTISNSGVTSFNGSTGAVTGVSSLGGLTASSQSLAIGTSGTAPNWSSVTSTHTLNIPMASTAGVTAGLISNADWTTFNNKQAALTAGSGISISSNTVTNTGVRSFNTRTGAVTLTSSDVTGALTYTPVNKAGDTMTGTLTATGFLYSSDRRLKENIETIHSALDKVLALRGVTFQWRATGKKDLGFIAQEVEKVVPRLVGERPDGYKAVEYGNIVALTVEAIKTLKAKIDSLFEHDSVQDREIAAMKKEVELLKNQVEQQNAVIQAQGEALRKLAGEKQ